MSEPKLVKSGTEWRVVSEWGGWRMSWRARVRPTAVEGPCGISSAGPTSAMEVYQNGACVGCFDACENSRPEATP